MLGAYVAERTKGALNVGGERKGLDTKNNTLRKRKEKRENSNKTRVKSRWKNRGTPRQKGGVI